MAEKSCSDLQQLTLYYYRELDEATSKRLANHLEQCTSCHTVFEQIKSSMAAVPTAELQLNSVEKLHFTTQVMARTAKRQRWKKPLWGSALAASTALLLALALLPTLRQQPTQTARPTLADLEILEQLDLLQNLEILQDLDVLEELEDLG